jgi:hypothetical protein
MSWSSAPAPAPQRTPFEELLGLNGSEPPAPRSPTPSPARDEVASQDAATHLLRRVLDDEDDATQCMTTCKTSTRATEAHVDRLVRRAWFNISVLKVVISKLSSWSRRGCKLSSWSRRDCGIPRGSFGMGAARGRGGQRTPVVNGGTRGCDDAPVRRGGAERRLKSIATRWRRRSHECYW